jgi:hypothetical protein
MISFFDFQIKTIPFLIGVSIAFLGWILYWVGLNVTGALLGGSVGVAASLLAAWIFAQHALRFPLVLIFGFTGMILGVFLIRKVHKIVFFLVGLIIGLFLGDSLRNGLVFLGLTPQVKTELVVLSRVMSGIAGGILVCYFNRFIISFLTAFCGSLIMMTSWDLRGGLIPFFPIFFLALFFQLFILRSRRNKYNS